MSAMKCPSLFELPVVSLAKGYGEGRKSRLPSPQRGRGAGGEGEFPAPVGCVPSRLQQASPTFIVKSRLRATPPHPQPLSPSREARGAEFSIFSQLQSSLVLTGRRLVSATITLLLFSLSKSLLPRFLRQNPPC